MAMDSGPGHTTGKRHGYSFPGAGAAGKPYRVRSISASRTDLGYGCRPHLAGLLPGTGQQRVEGQ